MSGRHSWTDLLERTYTSEERAAISADGDKIVADNRRRQARRARRRNAAPAALTRPGRAAKTPEPRASGAAAEAAAPAAD